MATVSTYLIELADKLKMSQAQQDRVNSSVTTIQNRINSYFRNNATYQVEDIIIFGSYARGTIVNNSNKSDVDIMVLFQNSNEYVPQTFLNKLKDFANNSYSTSEIKQSTPTIKIELSSIIFELVPSYQKYVQYGLKDYYIPSTKDNYFSTDGWQKTDFMELNKKIKEKCRGSETIYRLILLMKSWCAKNNYIQSYKLEENIVNTSYYGCYTLFDYLYQFVVHSSWQITTPLDLLRQNLRTVKGDMERYPYTALSKIKEINF